MMNSKQKISVLVQALQRWLYPWLSFIFHGIDRLDGWVIITTKGKKSQ